METAPADKLPPLSPLAQAIHSRLRHHSAVIPAASSFIHEIREMVEAKGFEISGEEIGLAFNELVRAGLARIKVRKDYMGLVPLNRFRGVKFE